MLLYIYSTVQYLWSIQEIGKHVPGLKRSANVYSSVNGLCYGHSKFYLRATTLCLQQYVRCVQWLQCWKSHFAYLTKIRETQCLAALAQTRDNHSTCQTLLFLAYGTRISASTSGAGKLYLTPQCKTGRVR